MEGSDSLGSEVDVDDYAVYIQSLRLGDGDTKTAPVPTTTIATASGAKSDSQRCKPSATRKDDSPPAGGDGKSDRKSIQAKSNAQHVLPNSMRRDADSPQNGHRARFCCKWGKKFKLLLIAVFVLVFVIVPIVVVAVCLAIYYPDSEADESISEDDNKNIFAAIFGRNDDEVDDEVDDESLFLKMPVPVRVTFSICVYISIVGDVITSSQRSVLVCVLCNYVISSGPAVVWADRVSMAYSFDRAVENGLSRVSNGLGPH